MLLTVYYFEFVSVYDDMIINILFAVCSNSRVSPFHILSSIITMLARFVRKFPVQRLARLAHTEAASEAAPKMFGVRNRVL